MSTHFFSDFPGTLFLYFYLSLYSIDTIFILGDGLTRLLLRWLSPAAALGKICYISFLHLGAGRASNPGHKLLS
jgi:hypothetical protein